MPDIDDRMRAGDFDPDRAEPMAPLEGEAPTLVRFREVAGASLDRFKRRASGEERPVPVPFEGLRHLYGGGLWPGLHVYVGGTGEGKTAMALQMALHCADPSNGGVPCVYIGLELGRDDWVARLLGERRGLPWSELFLGRIDAVKVEAYRTASEAMADWPLYLVEGTPKGWPYDRLEGVAKSLRTAHPEGPALIVLDFLQLVGAPEGVREDLRERIGRAAYTCRSVASKYGCAVLVLSSVARNSYAAVVDDGNEPKLRVGGTIEKPGELLGLGKESGDIEYSADTVLVSVRRGDIDRDKGTKYGLALSKVRAGVPGWVPVLFHRGRFLEGDTPTQATPDLSEMSF
ncbi:MAG: AAA family ATPase [Planctomycetes bacterium]|nr:AAA family ATPase [Planctomycetota bacterium]